MRTLRASFLCAIFAGLCLGQGTRSAQVDSLIGSLAAPDPGARQAAVSQLMELGAAARPALLEATRSDDPEIRSRAAQLLLDLPWHGPQDPEPVRKILSEYGKLDDERRIHAAARLAMLEDGQGLDALLRLLREEPSETVQWGIVLTLRQVSTETTMGKLRELPADSSRGPCLIASGVAWLSNDPAVARERFRRALELEGTTPTQDFGQLSIAYAVLIDADTASGRYDDAAELLRRQAARQRVSPNAHPSAATGLFALHANHGPLADFGRDLRTCADHLNRSEILYAVGRMFDRQGQALLARTFYVSAFALGLRSQENRLRAGDFLVDQKWHALAERELQAVLQLGGEDKTANDINAHFHLSRLAAARQDDAAAAEHLTTAMQLAEAAEADLAGRAPFDPFRPIRYDEVWAEIHWRSFRAARAKNDVASADKHLAELVKRKTTDMEIVLEIVPALKQMQRDDEARALFDASYAQLKARLDDDPTSPEHMNNLAWLCARCDERLEEALQLSQRAVAAAPNNAAYLDTAAEANFRLGRAEEAIRLETRALELQSNDAFMKDQLARFRNGRQAR